MRTQDRPYKEFLAHTDPDRKTPLHDQACLYLASPEKALKIAKLFVKLPEAAFNRVEDVSPDWRRTVSEVRTTFSAPTAVSAAVHLSYPLLTGKGWIVGYADLLIKGGYVCSAASVYAPPLVFEMDPHGKSKQRDEPLALSHFQRTWSEIILVEVKAYLTSAASIIQQFSTYMNGRHAQMHLLLCTLYPLGNNDREALKQHEITTIYVDPKDVETFIANQGIAKQENF